MRRAFRFPEFSPGFGRATELRPGDEVVPIERRDGSWALSRDPTVLRHGAHAAGGRRHSGAVSAGRAHGLCVVRAIAWSSRPLPAPCRSPSAASSADASAWSSSALSQNPATKNERTEKPRRRFPRPPRRPLPLARKGRRLPRKREEGRTPAEKSA